MSSVAIIGGGITGLTAAFRLQQRGVPTTVYEATGRVGGVIRSAQRDGYLAEFGPNTILETSPKIASLVRDLGLEDHRLYSDPRAGRRFIVRGGRPLNVPGSPAGFFASPLFSLSAKLRLLREPFVPPAPPDAEESVAELVLRRLGQEFLDYAINPLVAGIYAGDPARLSVKHAFPKLHALEQRYGSLIKGQILGARERKRRAEVSKQTAPKVSFRGGLQDLVQGLQHQLADALRLEAPVRRVARTEHGWRVTAGSGSRESAGEHSAVLFAAPTYQLAELQVEAGSELSLKPLVEVRYPPVASVVLGFRRADVAHPLDGFGMLIPQVERTHILGTIFSSSLFRDRAPTGHVTLTSYVGGTRAPELTSRPEEELVALTCRDLRAILGVSGPPTFQHVVVYPRAIPQYEVGYGRFKDLMTRIETQAPGLFFAGHYRDGIALGDSILSAHDVAERIAQFIATPPVTQASPRRGAEPTPAR
jgi:protoporphyrinogen/coproporphyrinogen III oxidase